MRNVVKISLLTFALALLSAPAWAQVGSLEGKVLDENGEGVQNAKILLDRLDIKGHYEVKTKKKGLWFHAGLPLGQYKVSLEVDGKVVDSISGIPVSLGDNKPVNFDLGEVKKRMQAAQAAANQGQQASQDQLKSMSPEQRKAYEESLKKRQQQLSKNKELNESFNAGMTAKQAGDWQAAADAFTKASTMDAEQDVIWAQLAEAQGQLAQSKTGDERKQLYDDAVTSYQKAMELKPTDAAYVNNLGLTMIRAGQTDEGKAMLAKAAEMDPANGGKYYFNLGAVMINAGDTEGAAEAFRKATEVQPDYASAWYQLGTTLVGQATYKEDGSVEPVPGTVEAFKKYLELEPNGVNAPAAQSMIASLTGAVETSFENPDAPKKKK